MSEETVQKKRAAGPEAEAPGGIGVGLLGLADIEHGAALHAESRREAARIARELSEGLTRAERIAVHEFLTSMADEIRWPGLRWPAE